MSRAETVNEGPRQRRNEGEEDNEKTNVCQYKQYSACQSIPL